MPYSTSNSPGLSQAANALARIFVGDPEADAKYRDQQVQNETEFARQKLLSEQAVTEGIQRKQMEAAAAASYALAAERNAMAGNHNRENKAYNDLGNLFTQDFRDFSQTGGASMPGDAPAGTPGAGFDLNNPAIAAKVLAPVMRGNVDPKILSSLAIMPGQDDATLGRIMTGSGQAIGKDDYVSVGDRNTNRMYELGATERLVGGDGGIKTGVDPSYTDSQKALSNQRNATANRQNAAARNGGGQGSTGGKVPRLDQSQMNSMLLNALLARGANIPKDDKGNYAMGAGAYLSGQPDLYADMARVIDEAYTLSGGRASAVQDSLAQYLGQADFSNFYVPKVEGYIYDEAPKYNPIQRPNLDEILAIIRQNYGAGITPEIFTEGGEGDLPNLQNVGNGNGSWQIIGVD